MSSKSESGAMDFKGQCPVEHRGDHNFRFLDASSRDRVCQVYRSVGNAEIFEAILSVFS